MRVEESKWLGEQLAKLPDISPVLELGSSTLDFRTKKRPHIDRFLHRPLRERNVRVVHSDFKRAEGVDIVGDIFSPEVQRRINALSPRTILCCNMFEHVRDPMSLAQLCSELLPSGGYMVFSGPYSYPYHADPVDNLFRPTPAEVAAMFPAFDIVASSIVKSSTWGTELLHRPARVPTVLLESMWRLVKFWRGRETYFQQNHRLLWLFRRYKLTCVILRKR